jgi:cyclopropane fatty-acyl-phospholipid synthase-like methyltransferase
MSTEIKISPTGYYIGHRVSSCHFDQKLAELLANLFRGYTVADFGCGHGDYVRFLQSQGIDCQGFDGNPNTPNYCPGCFTCDLSEPLIGVRQWDWILSLEVGEHIPLTRANTFLANVADFATKGIVISWAVPGQGGYGHINEQPNSFVSDYFSSAGFYQDHLWQVQLRQAASIWWFKESLMVFRYE